MSEQDKIIVGITQGDHNGIGPEVVMKALADPLITELCTPVIFSSQKTLHAWRKVLGEEEINPHVLRDWSQMNGKKVNLFNCFDDEVNVQPGSADGTAGAFALKALDAAVAAVKAGHIHTIVTAPLDKHTVAAGSPGFKGHTEYLQEKDGSSGSLMILMQDNLRVGLVTGHMPLKDVAAAITKERIITKAQMLHKSLIADFGIRKPRIAVLGLNPHAGDNGELGKEEQEIISPAIEQLRQENIWAFGPYPADGFFGSGNWKNFDGVLAMYHDQGLAPFKALSFAGGVNFTAGLSFVRTSPDHGTAYDIAGKNTADAGSLRQAIYSAIDIYRKRNEWAEIASNPLPFQPRQKEHRERY